MQLENTREILREFGKYVVKQSRSNLSRGVKGRSRNVSKKLYSSIKYDILEYGKYIIMNFLMEDYGSFVDKGVSGTKRKYATPFSYKSKKPPLKNILGWVKARKFRFRDKKGKFTKGTYRNIAFVLQNSIYEKGFKPSLFFTRPFEIGLQRFREDIVDAFIKDIDAKLDLDDHLPGQIKKD